MKKYIYIVLIAELIFFSNITFANDTIIYPPPSTTSVPDKKAIWNLTYENDIFNSRDESYTNGVRLAWLSSERSVPDPLERMANKFFPIDPKGKKRVSFAIGQSMFTPQDLTRSDLIENDRPYAGWLYTSYGIISDTSKTLDNLMVTIGVVGPLSLAEQTQKNIHEYVTHSPNPEGWSHQLHNEPGINLSYERKWRDIIAIHPHGFGFDFTPNAGFNLGNVNTDASVGMTVRIGYDLPSDYGPPRIRPSLPGSDFFMPTKRLGGYLFAGLQGKGVIRNIFLDGNTFGHSHSVDKKPFVADLQAGIAMTCKDWRIAYTQIFLTKEFYNQNRAARFGSLSVSYRY